MVFDHEGDYESQWAAMRSISEKIGCTAETLRKWVDSMEFSEFEGGFTVEEVSGSGDLAYVMWTFESSWMEAGVRVEAEGKGLSLFRREEDGSWRTSRNAWNLNP